MFEHRGEVHPYFYLLSCGYPHCYAEFNCPCVVLTFTDTEAYVISSTSRYIHLPNTVPLKYHMKTSSSTIQTNTTQITNTLLSSNAGDKIIALIAVIRCVKFETCGAEKDQSVDLILSAEVHRHSDAA